VCILRFYLHNPNPIILGVLFIVVFWVLNRYRYEDDRLSHYPSPWIASITRWYRAYFDVVKSGGLLDQVKKLHSIYGPVVRIGPKELHFNSPEAFFEIYSYQNFSKEPSLYNSYEGQSAHLLGVCSRHFQTRVREETLALITCETTTLKFEWVIREKVEKLISKMLSFDQTPLDFHMGVRSATIDILAKYCFADEFSALDFPKFQHPILVGLQDVVTSSWILKYLPWMLKILENSPDWIIDLLPKEHQFFRDLRMYASIQIDKYVENPDAFDPEHQPMVYHYLLSPRTTIPSRSSLMGETMALIAAGHDTVGGAVIVGTYHVLRNPHVHRRLGLELQQAWPDMHSGVMFQTLEKLPYLTAVIKESLRISHGVVSSLPRVAGEELYIAGHFVPKDTVVSMSATFIHLNDDIFESSLEFQPE
ncbi:cytochrome P450, partial [Cyathus striatus]